MFSAHSYGDSRYREAISAKGSEIIGPQFHPVTCFMDYREYVMFLQSCSVMIMNHRRQQAGGNVSLMLFLGGTVFLRAENPLYHHWRRKGAIFFSVQELEEDDSLLSYKLSDSKVETNKNIIIASGAWTSCIERTEKLLMKCT